MGRPGWYNDNVNRAFPFVRETVDSKEAADAGYLEALPDSPIADAGFVMGMGSGFVADLHQVYLHEVSRTGTTFTFEFRCDAPGLYLRALTFTRSVGDEAYLTEHVDDDSAPYSSESLSVSVSDDCPRPPLWYGYLVTGDMTALETLLPGDGTLTRRTSTGAIVEPSLIQNDDGMFVTSINLANDDRVRVDAPDGCPDIVFPFETDLIYVNAECLQGDVRIKPGYNASVQYLVTENVIEIGASVGAGEGEPCEEIKLFESESPPDDSQLLTGGPLCNELIRSINGIGGRRLDLLVGRGVSLELSPETSTITVNVNMDKLATCYTSDLVSADSQVSESL